MTRPRKLDPELAVCNRDLDRNPAPDKAGLLSVGAGPPPVIQL